MTAVAARIDARAISHHVRLIDLVPQDPPPKRVGRDAWKALCPFHAEKTPSMSVRLTARGWRFHCFGCGEDGDVVDYVMRTSQIGFLEACGRLGATALERPPVPLHRPPLVLICDGGDCGVTRSRVELQPSEVPGIGHTSAPGWAHMPDGRAYCPRCRLAAWARANKVPAK